MKNLTKAKRAVSEAQMVESWPWKCKAVSSNHPLPKNAENSNLTWAKDTK
jgi:hypothetical protein